MTNILVITGGSRGIGAATIHRFMREGWQVINISRTSSEIANVTDINMDLLSANDIIQHAAKLQVALEHASQVALVHNAAFYERDCLDTLKITDLQKTLTVNVIAPVILNQLMIPFMPKGSSIVYLGSTLAKKAVPGNASYIISKHALIGLMRATCQDLSDMQIRSCCICPGLVDTKLLKDTMDNETLNFLLESKVIGKRLIEPEEIADVIYFCAITPCINGTTIDANLGQMAD